MLDSWEGSHTVTIWLCKGVWAKPQWLPLLPGTLWESDWDRLAFIADTDAPEVCQSTCHAAKVYQRTRHAQATIHQPRSLEAGLRFLSPPTFNNKGRFLPPFSTEFMFNRQYL